MYVKLIAQKTPGGQEFRVFTLSPPQEWGRYSAPDATGEMERIGDSPGVESFHKFLVDDWR